MRIKITIAYLIFSVACIHAQIKGVITDKKTHFPIPFASLSYELGTTKSGMIANAKGEFSIVPGIRTLTVSCIGYNSLTVYVTAGYMFVELEENEIQLNEILIRPGNNPALRIIREALKNKDSNNFERYDNYSYRCYQKTVLGGLSPSSTNSSEIKNDKNTYLISENLSLCRKSEGATEEKIIATRTSGLKTPVFGEVTYTLFYKAISFYNNNISIFGGVDSENKLETDYLSPLCDGCLNIYNYYLENEFINEEDTVFEISYFPKKNKNLNALRGKMYISSQGYALKSIVAQPNDKRSVTFTFKQEYARTDGRWFPSNLEEEIAFKIKMPVFGLKKFSDSYPAYFVSAQIDSVSFVNQTFKPRLETIFLDEKSIKNSDTLLNRYRPVSLTKKEIEAYHQIDSVMKKRHYIMDYVINGISGIDEGKISINKIDVDLPRIYSRNRFENSRWGLGLHTNENMIKFISIGGYFGYGIKDRKWKYGGDVEFIFNRARDVKLKYSYQNSLKELGREMTNSFGFVADYLRNLESWRFDQCVENRLEASAHIVKSLKINLLINTNKLSPLYEYSFRGNTLPDYVSDYAQISLRYAPGAKYSTLGKHRLNISGGNPVFNLTYTRGVNFLHANSFIFNKLEASMHLVAYNGRIGQTNLFLEGGYIDRPLPCGLLFTGEGSKDELFSYFIPRTFQTMLPYEFLSDRYANLFFTHNFGSLLLKTKKFSPELNFSYNAGWGNLENASEHADIQFQIKNHIYQETGLIIDNLFNLKYMDFFAVKFG
ncbi:MAG: DUF5686 and carboxypeptidase regulatory-like domain-containing protein, partial [Candidatus Symbiothrix sp.]|nr:DUF5686 and carboxypeptidase regulatory-like domain-containing protein [Candidatus Symbiothrix sp.]